MLWRSWLNHQCYCDVVNHAYYWACYIWNRGIGHLLRWRNDYWVLSKTPKSINLSRHSFQYVWDRLGRWTFTRGCIYNKNNLAMVSQYYPLLLISLY